MNLTPVEIFSKHLLSGMPLIEDEVVTGRLHWSSVFSTENDTKSQLWSLVMVFQSGVGAMFQVLQITALTLVFAASAAAQSSDDAAESAAVESARMFFQTYLEHFNSGDAQALAAHWTADAEHLNRESGEKVRGREALLVDFQARFEESPGVHLTGGIDDVREVTADVLVANGRVTLTIPDSEPVESAFSAVLVREGNEWLIDSVSESSLPTPESSHQALEELAWLVGDWADQTEGVSASSTCRWSAEGAFLVRSFTTEFEDGSASEGTQVIGWDPRAKQIRSWTFNSDGSFGDAWWSKSGEEWLVKTMQTLADGSAASGTYVMTPQDGEGMTVALVGHQVNGEPQPSREPVHVVRHSATHNEGGE